MALEYLNSAILLDVTEISSFIIRSQCFLRLGRNSEALKDAETAMEMERYVLVLVSGPVDHIVHMDKCWVALSRHLIPMTPRSPGCGAVHLSPSKNHEAVCMWGVSAFWERDILFYTQSCQTGKFSLVVPWQHT